MSMRCASPWVRRCLRGLALSALLLACGQGSAQTIDVHGPTVGVHRGAAIEALSPAVLAPGTTNDLDVYGPQLDQAATAAVVPSDGVALGALAPIPGGLRIQVTVDANAVAGLRRLDLRDGANRRIPELTPQAAAVLVADPAPRIDSVDPRLVQAGSTVRLLIRGANLRGLPFGRTFDELPEVRIVPADGIALATDLIASDDGSVVELGLAVAADASLGARRVEVETGSGISTAVEGPNNRIEIVADAPRIVAPIVAPMLGVQRGIAVPVVEGDLVAPMVGIARGPAALGLDPGSVEQGEQQRLRILGNELADAQVVRLEPATGITLAPGSLITNPNEVSIDIDVAIDASPQPRQVWLDLPDRSLLVPELLEIRTPAPVVLGLTPNFVRLDGSSQTLRVQGSHLAQTTAAALLPPEDVVIEAYQPLDDNTALLTLRTLHTAIAGARVLSVSSPSGSSSAMPDTRNQLLFVNASAVRSPFVAPLLGVTRSTPAMIEPRLMVGAAVGVVRGAVVTARDPATLAQGETVRMVLLGQGLDTVDSLKLQSDDGVLVGPLQVTGSDRVEVDLSVAADAELGPRRLVLRAGTQSIAFATPALALVEIVPNVVPGPVAEPDAYAVPSNGILTVPVDAGVLVNDSDPEGGTLSAVLRRPPQAGELVLNADGSFVYTPAADVVGIDRFEYSAAAGGLIGAATTVTLSIAQIDEAVDDAYAGDDQTQIVIPAAAGVLANDVIGGGDVPEVVLVSPPAFGSLQLAADGAFVYTPSRSGSFAFSYRLQRSNGSSLPAQVDLFIAAINDPPLAVDDDYVLDRGQTLVRAAPGVLANDSDPDGDPLSARLITPPVVGSASISPNGALSYTPPPDFTGLVEFPYEVADPAGLTAQAMVRINVNDGLAPSPDHYTLNEGEILLVETDEGLLANDSLFPQGPLRIEIPVAPQQGMVQVANDGSFVYTPADADYFGPDQFQYRLRDDVSVSVNVAVNLTILPVNDPPTATADSYLLDENVPLNVTAPGVLENDEDVEGDPLSAQLLVPPANGQLQLRSDGGFSYTPNVNYRGPDQFEYLLVDGQGGEATGLVLLSVTPPPIATNDVYFIDTDEPLDVPAEPDGLLANDYDEPEDDPLALQLLTGPQHGTAIVEPTGAFSYVPESGFVGVDTMTYTATDGRSSSNVATVTIAVGVVGFPQAVDDQYDGVEDVVLEVDALNGVLANDIDTDTPREELRADLIRFDVRGLRSVELAGDGSFQAEFNQNYSGQTFFEYVVFDGNAISNAARVVIDVAPVNDGVVANDDVYGVIRNTLLQVAGGGPGSISFNDRYDADHPVAFSVEQSPASGSVQLNTQTGAFTYAPAPDFAGVDSFVYRVTQTDAGLFDTATVTLRTNGPPEPQPDAYTLTEDSSADLLPHPLVNDTDPDGDTLRLLSLRAGDGQGNVLVDFDALEPTAAIATARRHFYGLQIVRYLVTDGTTFASADIAFTVLPVPDDPIAAADQYLTPQDTPLNINQPNQGVLGNDYDPDTRAGPSQPVWPAATGDDLLPLVAELVQTTAHGTLLFTEIGTFSYQPDAGFTGWDEFRYRVIDGTGRISETVAARIRVNSPAQAADDVYVAIEDIDLVVPAAEGLLINDSDIDGDPLEARSAGGSCAPAHGTVTIRLDGGFTYRPFADYFGPDSFCYTVRDGVSGSDIGTVTLSVLPVNDAPRPEADTYRIDEDQVLVAPEPQGLLRNDLEVDGETLGSAAVVREPQFGAVLLEPDGAFSYTPEQDANGIDSFRYRVEDQSGLFAETEVEIVVVPVNDTPVAHDDDYQVRQDQSLTVAAIDGVLSNDQDVDGPELRVALLAPPAFGALALQPDGSFSYQPDGVYVGTDLFQYQLDDGLGALATATVRIVVAAAPVPIVVTTADDQYDVPSEGLTVTVPGVLGNDQVSGAPTLVASLVLAPTRGSLDLQPDGGFSYLPQAGFAGSDGFTYAASAGDQTALARVTLNVVAAPINLPPVAVGEQFVVLEDYVLDSASAGNLLANDSDPEGAALTLVLVDGPAHGSLEISANGDFDYRPAPDFHGDDGFDYRANDGVLESPAVRASIAVTPVNDSPVAVDDLYQTTRDQPLVVDALAGLLANDGDVDGDSLSVAMVDTVSAGSLQVAADGGFSYLPPAGESGTVNFRYAVSDGTAWSLASVTIQITAPGNQPPSAVGESYQTDEDVPLVRAAAEGLLANDSDPDGDVLGVILIQPPADGDLSLQSDGAFSYLPAPNWHGSDQFRYVVSDGSALSDEVAVDVLVESRNDPPLARTDSYAVLRGASLNIAASEGVLLNDEDVDGDPLTVSLEAPAAFGIVDLAADGSFSYQADPLELGRDEFAYRLSDGIDSVIGRVVIDLLGAPNTRPVAQGEQFVLPEDTLLDTRDDQSLLANDYDPDGDPLTLVLLEPLPPGEIELLPDGHLRVQPPRDFHGSLRIPYEVSDGSLAAGPVEAELIYLPRPDAPLAQPDAYVLAPDNPTLSVSAAQGVLANDSDADGDTLVAILSAPPAHGELDLNLDGSFAYSPALTRPEQDQFSYRAEDPSGRFAEASVDIYMEIVAVRGYREEIIAFEHDGSLKWRSPVPGPGIPVPVLPPPPFVYDTITIVNLEGDNEAEVILGRLAYRGETGELLWEGEFDAGGSNGGKPIGHPLRKANGIGSVAADVDLDGIMEIVAGRTLYDHEGRTVWHRADINPDFGTDAVGTPINDSGEVAIGNFDDDDFAEIVITSGRELYVLNHDGSTLWGPNFAPDSGRLGAPTVADIDADGLPEILVSSNLRLTAFETDGTEKWTADIDDPSSITSPTVFDFDDDGLIEVVHMDEFNLRIFEGATGALLFETRNTSETVGESPVVADVDGDQQAEIIVAGFERALLGGTTPGIRVFEARNGAWADAGSVWGSHSFHIDNIREDSTIPLLETPSWLTHNTYRVQRSPEPDPLGLPDFSVGDLRLIDAGPGQPPRVRIRAGNAGPVDAHEPPYLTIYRGDPAAGGVPLQQLRLDNLRAARFLDVELGPLSLEGSGDLYALIDPADLAVECREQNNQRQIPFSASQAAGVLALASDRLSYQPGEAVTLTADVTNTGALPAGYRVEWFIRNAQNQLTAPLPDLDFQTMAAASTAQQSDVWSSAGTLAGAYTVIGRLYDRADRLLANAMHSFDLAGDVSGPAGSLAITPSRAAYAPVEVPLVYFRAQNLSSSEIIRLPEVRIDVSGPDGYARSFDRPLEDLFIGAFIDAEQALADARRPGTYQVEASLRSRLTGLEYATASTSFERLSDVASGVVGFVQVAAPELPLGAVQNCGFSVRNLGDAISGLPVRWRVVELDSGTQRFEATATIDLASGADWLQQLDLPTNGFDPVDHACLLEAQQSGGDWRILDSEPFTLLAPAGAAIGVEPTSGLMTSEAGQTAFFDVSLSRAPSAAVTVPLQLSDPTEWSLAQSEVVFDPATWDLPRRVTITGVDDDLVDGDQTGQIVLLPAQSADPDFAGIDPTDVEVTNLDDDSVQIRVQPLALQTGETGTIASFELSLNAEPTAEVDISLVVSDATEWMLSTATVRFTPADWQVAQSVLVTGLDDDLLDGTQSGAVLIGPASSADPRYDSLDPADVTLTNLDDDSPAVLVDPIELVTAEGGTAQGFTVRLSAEPTAPVQIPLGFVDASEWRILDLVVPLDSATWQAGYTVEVAPVNDDLVDGDQQAVLQLGPASSADLRFDGLDVPSVALTNLDDDAAQVLVTPLQGLFTDEAGASVTVEVRLTIPPASEVRIPVANPDVTEFSPDQDELVFPAGQTGPLILTITGVDDALVDGNQLGRLGLAPVQSADPAYAGIDPPDPQLVNLDDDEARILVLPGGSLATSESGTSATLELRLSAEPSAPVSVSFSNPDETEWSLDANELVFDPADWNTPRLLTITGVDDFEIDGDILDVLELQPAVSADPAYAGIDPIDVPLLNRDDDQPAAVDISPSTGIVTGEDGSSALISFRLSTRPQAEVLIRFANPDATEFAFDVTEVSIAADDDWQQPRQVVVTGVDDDIVDGDISTLIVFEPVSSDDARYAGLELPDLPATNLDNDVLAPAELLIEVIDTDLSEAGDGGLLRVSLNRAPTSPVTVQLQNSLLDEAMVTPLTVLFAADTDPVPQDIVLLGLDDDIVDGDQFGQIDFSVAAGSDPDFIGLSQSVSFVNRDDDEAGILLELTGPPSIDEGQSTTLALSLRSQPLAPLQITLAARIQSPGLPDDLDYALTPIAVHIDPADWDQPVPLTLATTDNQRSTGDRIIEVQIKQIGSTDPLYPNLTAPPVEVTVIDQGAAIEALPIPVDRGMGWLIAALLLLASAYLTSRPAPARSEEASHG